MLVAVFCLVFRLKFCFFDKYLTKTLRRDKECVKFSGNRKEKPLGKTFEKYKRTIVIEIVTFLFCKSHEDGP